MRPLALESGANEAPGKVTNPPLSGNPMSPQLTGSLQFPVKGLGVGVGCGVADASAVGLVTAWFCPAGGDWFRRK